MAGISGIISSPLPACGFCGLLLRAVAMGFLAAGLSACEPSDRTPGLWLTGELSEFPGDWTFTEDHKEIFIEVSTPYFISHSVTIWCAALDGDLYIGASNPDAKHWPGWVDAHPDIRLKIGDRLYDGRVDPLDDAETLTALRTVYARKYDLPEADGRPPTDARYWRIIPRP